MCCLQRRFPVHCYAFAVPGASMSVPLSDAVSSFITSVVVGKDMVIRLSLRSVHSLLEDAVRGVSALSCVAACMYRGVPKFWTH